MLDHNITVLAQGFALGGSLIVAIGAQNAYVLRQGLRRQHVLAITTTCFFIDLVLIAAGAGGFGRLVAAAPWAVSLAAWGGAAFLIVYGLRAFRAALHPGALTAEDQAERPQGVLAAIGTALAISLLNPHVYLDTVILIGSIAGQFPASTRPWFLAGAMCASGIWFYGLGFGAGRLAPLFARPVAWRVLDFLIGCIMWAIAASLIAGEITRT